LISIHENAHSAKIGGQMKIKTYTADELRAYAPEKLAVLYQNAVKHRENGGKAIIDLIHELGLPLSSGGMRTSDPAYMEMEKIVWSAQGRKRVVEATEKGLPALSGVEPMIVAELRERYHPHDQGTLTAGSIVAALMRHLGYIQDREGKMPEGSVAKTAMKWKRPPK
jgi:hypothetical protein